MSPSTSIPHAFSLALFPDPDLSHQRHNDDVQRGLHVSKKHSKSGVCVALLNVNYAPILELISFPSDELM
jgi:hypothetical protein